MKMWWRLWSGHVFLGVTLALMCAAAYFLVESMRGMNSTTIFVNFVVAALFGLLMVIAGVFATWNFRTHRDRYYLRRQEHLLGNALPPVDALDTLDLSSDTKDVDTGAHEAHSADEEVSHA